MNGKKRVLVFVMILTFGLSVPAWAWLYVGPMGDTGWQTFTYTAGPSGFSGIAGFVVSNQGDNAMDSFLLLDNLSHGSTNLGFETGNYTGYTLVSPSDGTVVTGPVYGLLSGNEYNPTHGNYMSYQGSFNTSTSGFSNAFGNPGTVGSILLTSYFSLVSGESFTFDWAFITWDDPTSIPGFGQDFALFYLHDGTDIVYREGLAQVVPVPATLLLFGSGLLSLAGIRLRKKMVK